MIALTVLPEIRIDLLKLEYRNPKQFQILKIEEPCSKLQGIFDRKEVSHF